VTSGDLEKIRGTFYEARAAEETLDRYLRSQDTLYDCIKNQQIKRLLEKEALGYKHVLEIGWLWGRCLD
jgi:molybdopterin/thiamine biosynthesis adenylyltransferase